MLGSINWKKCRMAEVGNGGSLGLVSSCVCVCTCKIVKVYRSYVHVVDFGAKFPNAAPLLTLIC